MQDKMNADTSTQWIAPMLRLVKNVCNFTGKSRKRGQMRASSWFINPVDVDLAPGYLDVITEPMDFSTIQKKLESNQYTSIDAANNDMLLVEGNCYAYNAHTDPITTDCREVFTYYRREYQRLFNRCQKVETPLTKKRRFPVGGLQRARKEARSNLAHSSAFKVISNQVDQMDETICEKENTLRELNADLAFLERLKQLDAEASKVETKTQGVQVEVLKTPGRPTWTSPAAEPATPTVGDYLNPDDLHLPYRTKKSRHHRTVQALQEIHGCAENNRPVKDGLWYSLTTMCTPEELASRFRRSKICKKLEERKPRPELPSEDKLISSLNVMYKDGLTSKRKYCSIRSSTKPRLLPYATLIDNINTIHDTNYTVPLEGKPGFHRKCELFIMELAQIYLDIDQHLIERGSTLNLFGKERDIFWLL
ncbi:bromodomain-containing protein 4-like [Lineus longissimus]|uniref:bromodomain-containing protein 4-like n=1 Tax=Lineus longissimus TaxID=88925 RepID=UPI00315D41D0